MDLAYQTGQRIGDLLEIKKADLHDDGIYIEQNKSNHKVKIIIEWTSALRNTIERIRKRNMAVSSIHLLYGRAGIPYTYHGISAMFRRAVKKAVIEDFHFHDIRAKSLTDLDRQVGNAQALAGHKNPEMTRHYIKRRKVQKVTPLKVRES